MEVSEMVEKLNALIVSDAKLFVSILTFFQYKNKFNHEAVHEAINRLNDELKKIEFDNVFHEVIEHAQQKIASEITRFSWHNEIGLLEKLIHVFKKFPFVKKVEKMDNDGKHVFWDKDYLCIYHLGYVYKLQCRLKIDELLLAKQFIHDYVGQL
jgi:hypothetical protein